MINPDDLRLDPELRRWNLAGVVTVAKASVWHARNVAILAGVLAIMWPLQASGMGMTFPIGHYVWSIVVVTGVGAGAAIAAWRRHWIPA